MTVTKPKFGPQQYRAGTDIIHQGDDPDQFFILTKGEVEIFRQYPDGSEVLIDKVKRRWVLRGNWSPKTCQASCHCSC